MKEETIKTKIMKQPLNFAKEVKSNYILKHIFSFLYGNKRLYLIKYNKIFQDKLDVDIKFFQEISGKYKIAERDGKG